MSDHAVRLFGEWADTGRAERMAASHAPRGVQALTRIPLQQGERCVDLGCGEGWASRWLAEAVGPDGDVVGVDGAAAMIAAAREKPLPGLRFEQASLLELPLADASVDHGFSMEALYYADVPSALAEAARVLRPGGTLTLCVDFYTENPDSHSWPADLGVPMSLLSEAEWCEQLRIAGFTDVAKARYRGPSSPTAPGTLGVFGRRTHRDPAHGM